MKRTAIIITTFNRASTTIKCIESLKNNSLFNSSFFDIYIADSNSKDQTVNKIKTLNSEIKIFNVGDNIYWSQGMNLAWVKAHQSYEYDFYIWLNDDTILNTEALKIIFKDYENVLKNSILVGVTSDIKGNITYGGRFLQRAKLSTLIIMFKEQNILMETLSLFQKMFLIKLGF